MKTLRPLIMLLAIFPLVFAQQDVEEMMKKMQEQVNTEIQKNEEAVQRYISKNDSLFAEFLKNEWKAFDTKEGEKRKELPKPDEIPAIPETKFEYKEYVPVEVNLPELDIDTKISPEITPPEISVSEEDNYKKIKVTFYDKELTFRYNTETRIQAKKPVNDKSIPAYWEAMSRVETKPMLQQIEEYSAKLGLNDYGKFSLVKKIASEIIDDEESRILFSWYLITKLGYDVRVGYGPGFTVLMVPSNNMLFARPYLTVNNQKYFIFNFDDHKPKKFNTLYSYDKKHPTANKYFDFSITKLPEIGNYDNPKQLKFKYQGQFYEFNYDYNEELVKFFDYYPQTDYSVYFKAPVAPQTINSFARAFKPILAGKPEQEALNIILRFVQTAFMYKTDNDHFGREKPLIPDETLYYPYSDCEDRSILFSILVEELLDLKAIGLKYDSHMAVGVKTKSSPKGDYVKHRGNKYLVCDPTYINANIGQSMPRYKNKGITVIDF
ncbi:MAG: hypothetical protein ACLFQM_08060 [Fidelibacterota bacterium]